MEPLAPQRALSSLVRPRRSGLDALVPWLIAAVVMSGLYFGKSVLVPIILAGLISFLLAPIARLLRRTGMPRALAVVVTVLLALASFGVVGSVITSQVVTLGKDAPAYAERISEKVQRARSEVVRRFDFLSRENPNFTKSGQRDTARARDRGLKGLPAQTASGALPVEVQETAPTALEELRTFVLPALAPLESMLIVLIVTIFILFQKDDLRDRAIRLMGAADLHRSTLALDEGARRLSRYFLSQFAINAAFGAIVWGSLYLLGVPAAGLWGMLAGLLRFVPYVGSVIAAIGPLVLAAAIGPDWGLVITVGLLFVVLEPLLGYVVEPLLYGHSTGLSPVSVVVAALFWTWIWGPVGLVLSMPLTLTLVVFGRHIPAFAFFDILLGDRPPLSLAETYYQRILMGHVDDVIENAEQLLDTMSLADYHEKIVLGALRLAAADVDRGAVARSAMQEVCSGTLDVVAALNGDFGHPDRNADKNARGGGPALEGRTIICIAGRGPLDAAVNAIAAQLLRAAGADVTEHARNRMLGRGGTVIDPAGADTICFLGLFDQRGADRILPLAQQLRDRYPGLSVFVGVDRLDLDAQPTERVPGSAEVMSLSGLVASVAATRAGAGGGSDT